MVQTLDLHCNNTITAGIWGQWNGVQRQMTILDAACPLHKQTFEIFRLMSALPPKAAIRPLSAISGHGGTARASAYVSTEGQRHDV